MPRNPFSHIDLRIRHMDQALSFYEKILPELGFKLEFHSDKWKVFVARGDLPGVPYFALTEQEDHQPDSSRVAFWVESNAEVDRMAEIVTAAGGSITDGPALFPYSDTYYAVYFTDLSGNRLEILHRVT